jgi:hypothetical protein
MGSWSNLSLKLILWMVFLDDLLTWAPLEFNIEVTQTGVRAYLSQLEVTTSVEDFAFKRFSDVGRLIASTLSGYGQIADRLSGQLAENALRRGWQAGRCVLGI